MAAELTSERVAEWLRRYLEAWKGNDREQIGSLFSDDISYRFHPYDEPTVGRENVVEAWLGEGDHEGAPDPDEPGTFEAEYHPIAVDGQVAVAVGRSSYRDQPGGEVKRVYDNCFVIRFDETGRCSEFTEWFMLQPDA
jgi:ketosteroid isomerase-like protein